MAKRHSNSMDIPSPFVTTCKSSCTCARQQFVWRHKVFGGRACGSTAEEEKILDTGMSDFVCNSTGRPLAKTQNMHHLRIAGRGFSRPDQPVTASTRTTIQEPHLLQDIAHRDHVVFGVRPHKPEAKSSAITAAPQVLHFHTTFLNFW